MIDTERANSIFNTLNAIDVNGHVEKKNGLSYLSWAWAWSELKKRYPNSYYTIYENKDQWNYFTDGNTCWVKTGVTVVDGDFSLENIELLPVMDYKNKSIPVGNVTSFEVNKTIQRSLTKAVARHGLGLYIYAGEDLPEDAAKEREANAEEVKSIIKMLDAEAMRLKKKLSPEELSNFGREVIEPTLGQKNYKTCTDSVKLSALLKLFKAA